MSKKESNPGPEHRRPPPPPPPPPRIIKDGKRIDAPTLDESSLPKFLRSSPLDNPDPDLDEFAEAMLDVARASQAMSIALKRLAEAVKADLTKPTLKDPTL